LEQIATVWSAEYFSEQITPAIQKASYWSRTDNIWQGNSSLLFERKFINLHNFSHEQSQLCGTCRHKHKLQLYLSTQSLHDLFISYLCCNFDHLFIPHISRLFIHLKVAFKICHALITDTNSVQLPQTEPERKILPSAVCLSRLWINIV